MKILSLFTHRHVVFNMYVFLSSVKHDFFFSLGHQHFSNIYFCYVHRKSFRFGTTWGWV